MYMSTELNQVHVLIPGKDLNRLKRIAKIQKSSVGELIRQAVHKIYGATEPGARKEAFQRLSNHDELEMTDWDQVKADLLKRYE